VALGLFGAGATCCCLLDVASECAVCAVREVTRYWHFTVARNSARVRTWRWEQGKGLGRSLIFARLASTPRERALTGLRVGEIRVGSDVSLIDVHALEILVET